MTDDVYASIRPLQTSDLRARKVSGRHQITEDGRHLIDGVPFGRPLLRRPSRPAIQIPPRKRRRIAYLDDELDASQGQSDDRRIALHRDSINGSSLELDNLEDEHSRVGEEEEDDEYGDQADEELCDEVEDLHADLAQADEISSQSSRIASGRRSSGSSQPRGLGLFPLVGLNGRPSSKLSQNHAAGALPFHYPRPGRSASDYATIGSSNGQRVSRAEKRDRASSSTAKTEPHRRDSYGSSKSVHFKEARQREEDTPVTVRQSPDSDDDGDDDGDDESYQPDDTETSDKENAPPRNRNEEASVDEQDNPDTSSTTSSETESSASVSTSSSDTSASNILSHSEPDELPIEKHVATESNSDLDSDSESSDSSSSSGSSSESTEGEPIQRSKQQAVKSTKSTDETTHEIPASVVAPGSGMQQTKNRNKRRRNATRRKMLQEKGPPPNVKEGDHQASTTTVNNKPSGAVHSSEVEEEIQKKRDSLLQAIDAAGIDVTASPDVPETQTYQPDEGSTLIGEARDLGESPEPDTDAKQDADQRPQQVGADVVQIPGSTEQANDRAEIPDSFQSNTISKEPTKEADASAASPESEGNKVEQLLGRSSHRPRLNKEGSNRMVFGSLGHRPPRSKEERAKLQAKLSQDRKPVKDLKSVPAFDEPTLLHMDPDDESWKDKIDLQAFECCHEGVEYSAPPFPFVQRWDPQQRRDYGKAASRRKQKKRKRNDNYYYDNQYDDSFNYEDGNKSPRRDDYNASTAEPQFGSHDFSPHPADMQQDTYEYHEDTFPQGETQGIEEGNQSASPGDDLPPLPQNLNELPSLTELDCRPGAVIAFRRLEMTSESNWVPHVAKHRTARIQDFQDDGTLHMVYARRDQRQSDREFDTQTGERIYNKFEMPGYDEEDDGSKVSIPFTELIEAVLVRDAEGNYPERPVPIPDSAPTVTKQENSVADSPDKSLCESIKNEHVNGVAAGDSLAETRNNGDMSQVFRDAGWRSSIGSDVKRQLELQLQVQNSATSIQSEQDQELPGPASPRFDGFSSPGRVENTPMSPSRAADTDNPLKAPEAERNTLGDSQDNRGSNEKTVTSVDYPTLPPVEDDSEYFPSERQHRSVSFELDTTTQSQSEPQAMPISPPSLRRRQSKAKEASPVPQQHSSSEKENRAFTFYNGAGGSDSDDDEFPELFSQKFEDRLSHEIQIKREASQSRVSVTSPGPKRKTKAKPKLKGRSLANNSNSNSGSNERTSSRLTSQRSNGKRKANSSQEFDDGEDDSFWLARPSQPTMTQESEIVDLTLRSDHIEHDTPFDADDSYKPPSSSMRVGSGWVDKGVGKKGGKAGKRVGTQV